ncbi:MFS transporter [Sphingobacterium sp. UGAL515B_05]|uniref:MFS transporter n=1 Tax=Sphingobacterium sp. UGAL515B_05 TaxID=2986767 RepID=UPI0029552489|nr:MFS transporter [Sphingobacterium sp. UGAL515B_05]WON95324.1 MFS transporter [Sphingobacterium sp. UGAL515B_05]
MISSLRHKSFYPWLVVALLWGVALLNYMDRQMLSTMREAMQVDIPQLQRAETFGVLMAVFLYIYGVMSPIAGIVADRSNRKWLIVGSLFVWSAVTYGMGMAHDYATLLVLRAIMGFSEALYIPTALSLIADYHTGKNRSLAIGLHMTGLYTGQALGGFGATLAASKGWHTAFHWFGIIGICYAVLLAILLVEKKHEPSLEEPASEGRLSLPKSLLLLFSNVAFWILLFYFAAPSLPGWAIKNWLPTLFADSLNIPMAKAGPLSTITIAISSFIGVIVGGILSDRWVQKNIRGRIYTSAIGLGLTIPALLFLGLGQTLPAVVGAAVCFGIGFGIFDANNMPILCQVVPKNLRATAYGFMNMVGVFAGAVITQWLGKFKDEGHFGLGFALLGGAVLLALLLQLLFLKPKTTEK